MATRSLIAIARPEGFDSIYCHWDGYPSNNGRILMEHYTDSAKVDALIAVGNLSSLGAEIGQKHDFNAKVDGQCTFYGRDRGEPDQLSIHSPTLEALGQVADDCNAEHVYLYLDGAWLHSDCRYGSTDLDLGPIADAVAADA